MPSRRTLARRLESVTDFRSPSASLEQYATPAEIAAHLLHLAALQDDLSDELVVDLGSGTGTLALGAALLGPRRVIGLELDADALAIARENEARLDPGVPIEWIRGDATRSPLCLSDAVVVMNPPFGAQRGNEHADRAFLERAAEIASVSYSIHNEGSESFVESFAADRGGTVTHAFRASFDLDRQFAFHRDDRRTIDAEAFRIEWSGP